MARRMNPRGLFTMFNHMGVAGLAALTIAATLGAPLALAKSGDISNSEGPSATDSGSAGSVHALSAIDDEEKAFLALKAEKEAFVSGFSGAPIWEVSLVVSIFPVGILLYRSLHAMLEVKGGAAAPSNAFALEFVCLVLPLVVTFTAAEWTLPLMAAMAGIAYLARRAAPGCASVVWPTGNHISSAAVRALAAKRKPFMTGYRAAMILSTCVAILAVDFTIFPRRFCKAEEHGTGLMDVGVGSFVFASALVSPQSRAAAPRAESSPRAAAAAPSRAQLLRRSARAASPMLVIGTALGVARYVVIKGVRYQEHVTEYGVHWNFFFTLAAVAVLSAALEVLLPAFSEAATGSTRFLIAGLCLAGVYQALLSFTGLRDYILNAPRGDNLFSQNREGICGVPGFLAIFLCGVWVGRALMSPRPGAEGARTLLRDVGIAAACLWAATLAVNWGVDPVSRRFTNLGYVLWTLAYNVQQLWVLLLLDLAWSPDRVPVPKPGILHGVNSNGLFIFLAANLSTGAVNLSMVTIHASAAVGYAVVTLYMLWVSGIAFFLSRKSLSLKFW